MNLDNAINTFINSVCAGKTNETPSAYRQKLKQLVRFLGPERDVSSILAKDIDDFRISLLTRNTIVRGHKEIKGHLSPFTIRTTLSTVRYFLGWAFKQNWIPVNLAQTVIMPKKTRPRPKAIEADAVLRMLHVAADTGEIWERVRALAIIYLLRDTGGRVGGLVNALVDDLELDEGQMMVVEKGDIPRSLFLNPHTIIAIRLWLQARRDLEPRDHHLFISVHGYGLSRGRIYTILREIALKAGVEGRYNPHAFRHAFARDTLRNGADLSRLASMMGHSTSVVTTEYYAVWDTRDLQELHRRASPGAKLPLILPELQSESV